MGVWVQMGCFVAPLVFMVLNMASPVGGENSVYPVRIMSNTCPPHVAARTLPPMINAGSMFMPRGCAASATAPPQPSPINFLQSLSGVHGLRLVVVRLRAPAM